MLYFLESASFETTGFSVVFAGCFFMQSAFLSAMALGQFFFIIAILHFFFMAFMFSQQGFLPSFMHFMALGQFFCISAIFGQQGFLSVMALGQFFCIAAIFAQQAFLSAIALGQFFCISAIFAQQGFLQSFLHFICFCDMGEAMGATVCTFLSAFTSFSVDTLSPAKPDTEKIIANTKMIPIMRFKINPPGLIISRWFDLGKVPPFCQSISENSRCQYNLMRIF